MDAKAVLLVAGLPFAPWAWRVLKALVAEAQAAADGPSSTGLARRTVRPVNERTASAHRVLAFRGVQARVAARGRWEGGFGRRNL